MASAATPADLTITPRNIAFGRGAENARWWMGGDPVATAFYNSMSITFPQGEAFFVESVRRFRDDAPEPLKSQIAAFVKQEVLHTREHVAFNRQISDAGYDIRPFEDLLREGLGVARGRHPVAQLAVTVALEHFTAIVAHSLLADPRHLRDAPEEARRMWMWHAMEEIEHKGVAYDTFLHVTRALPRRKQYAIRAKVMINTTINFVRGRWRVSRELLAQDGLDTLANRARLLWFLAVAPGMFRQVFRDWFAFFRPSFHPWDHDDRHLIAVAEAAIGREDKAAA